MNFCYFNKQSFDSDDNQLKFGGHSNSTSSSISNDSCFDSVDALILKQNWELWEQIERIFYGEESLVTTDEKTQLEFQEW
jgi:hypothetical protein